METLLTPSSVYGSGSLAENLVTAFRKQLRGAVLRPGDEGYEDARLVWNGMIDRRPALIARRTCTEDVVASVNFAREHDLVPAIRVYRPETWLTGVRREVPAAG